MKTCGTCVHWHEDEWGTDWGPYKPCHSPKLVDNAERDRCENDILSASTSGDGVTFLAMENFGCIHHQERITRTTDIFIRTYDKDLPWLAYALKSIHKYVTGYREIVICIPEGQGHLLAHLTQERVIEVEDLQDGYIGQQLTKMEAWRYTKADAIVYWDSDVIATEPLNITKDLFKDGKPILYKTRYSLISSHGHDCPWQSITEKAVGFGVEWEYMRRMPLTYLRDDIGDACAYLERAQGVSLRNFLSALPGRDFSEFNAIGAFIDSYRNDFYAIIDTDTIEMPRNKVNQEWSWGGVTPEVIERMKAAGL